MSELRGVAKALSFEGTAGWSLERKIHTLIAERNGYRNKVDDLRAEIRLLQIEMVGKDAVIAELHKDIGYYRKDHRDQMIQDQGLPADDA